MRGCEAMRERLQLRLARLRSYPCYPLRALKHANLHCSVAIPEEDYLVAVLKERPLNAATREFSSARGSVLLVEGTVATVPARGALKVELDAGLNSAPTLAARPDASAAMRAESTPGIFTPPGWALMRLSTEFWKPCARCSPSMSRAITRDNCEGEVTRGCNFHVQKTCDEARLQDYLGRFGSCDSLA